MFKTVLPLSAILSLRFFGLFLVLPVLSAYALHLEGATGLPPTNFYALRINPVTGQVTSHRP